MQIATNLFYDRSSSAMSSLTAKADALQTQISTTKQFSAPSQNSVAYQRLAGIKRDAADDKTYTANLGTAASIMTQGDTSLRAMSDQLQQVTTLVTQAKNGTLNAENLKAIGGQIAQGRLFIKGLGVRGDQNGADLGHAQADESRSKLLHRSGVQNFLIARRQKRALIQG